MRSICLAFLLSLVAPGWISAHEVADSMASAAQDFLASLSDEQKAKVHFELEVAHRKAWHFIPKPFVGPKARQGVPLKELADQQKLLAHGLLSTGLSNKGYLTALQVMSLEHVLWEMEHNSMRDAAMYYLTVYGKPGLPNWGWRCEGHHLSMNFTIANGEVITGTPFFVGVSPAEVQEGSRKGLRVLGADEDLARALVKSLSDDQRGEAVISDKAPHDILTGTKQKVDPFDVTGLNYTKLTAAQRQALHELIDVFVRRLRHEVADQEWTAITEAGLDAISFTWAGGLDKGEPHYYRIQGPTFILEYANTQGGANHVHAVWRDFDGDFGDDLLRQHYGQHHVK